ncbi:MAG TPA: hypothetical protein VKA46_09900 [Gemmataceae bacterium]|nr:hypothetical protein [Gemmataceae bacterium]
MISDDAILRLDAGDRVRVVSEVWPEFTDRILRAFRTRWDASGVHLARLRGRVKDFVEREPSERLQADFLG